MILYFFYWVKIIILFFNVWFFLGEILWVCVCMMCIWEIWEWCEYDVNLYFFFFLDNEFIKIYVYYINVSDV